jgi:hypothetical protein
VENDVVNITALHVKADFTWKISPVSKFWMHLDVSAKKGNMRVFLSVED